MPAAMMAIAAYTFLLFYLFAYPGLVTTNGGSVVINDFLSFWVAAREAVNGDPSTAYQTEKFAAIQTEILGRDAFFAFFYPPTYLLLILPLGLLSGILAFTVFQILSFAAVAWAGTRIAGHWHGVLLAAALPTTFTSIFHGQNGLLLSALLGGALFLLSQGRGILAGLLIGLMTIKPQMGVLIPFALLAGGFWRCFASASAATIIFVAVSVWVFGLETWEAFLLQSDFASRTLSEGLVDLHKFVSIYGATRLLGADASLAYGVQLIASLLALAVLVKIWRARVGFEAKAIVLVGAGLLATPFVLAYDLAVLLVPMAYLLRLHSLGKAQPWDMSLALVAILIAGACRFMAETIGVPLGPLVGLIILSIGVRHARSDVGASPS
ncbi:glycosyltransferase family 87 protein [Labrenzia sp. CE80]|uniref:glycosyltransferase family 87 protein n=1 Tax=Labrenzia sp. CE80 TaxID=1788986 RepID=UPI001389C52A|nr:glycosyltransferase family 87 protein [Labrenzia sp. CE80]